MDRRAKNIAEHEPVEPMHVEQIYAVKSEIDRTEALRVKRARESQAEHDDWDRSSRRSDQREFEDWQVRDQRLLGMTVGFGVAWGLSLVLVGVFAGLTHSQATDCIGTAASNDKLSQSCTRTTGLAAAMWTFTATASGAGAGFLASGITLGVHRSQRPRLSLAPAGMRLRF